MPSTSAASSAVRRLISARSAGEAMRRDSTVLRADMRFGTFGAGATIARNLLTNEGLCEGLAGDYR